MIKKLSFKQMMAWAVVLCILGLGAAVYMQANMAERQLQREIIFRKAQALAAQEQHERIVNYQKRFEQQRLRQEYNKGKVVGVKTSPTR